MVKSLATSTNSNLLQKIILIKIDNFTAGGGKGGEPTRGPAWRFRTDSS